jgi:anti-repressor protein
MEPLVLRSKKGNPVTTSLIVAEYFEKNHRDVLRSIENLISSAQNCAQYYAASTYGDSSGKSNKMFYMNRDGFMLLVMGFTGERSLKIKITFIEAFNEMEKKLHDLLPALPQTFAEALELAAKQAREIEKKDKIIAIQAPKADYATRVLADDSRSVDIGQAAKLLKLPFGRNTFFKKLREDGIFFKNRNEPMQEYIDAGYFTFHKIAIENKKHEIIKVVLKIYATSKGLYWLSKKYGGNYKEGLL